MLSLLTSNPDIATSIERRNVNSFFQSYSNATHFIHENNVSIDNFPLIELGDTILGTLTVSIHPDSDKDDYALIFDTVDQRFFDSVKYLGNSIQKSGMGLNMEDQSYSSKSDFVWFDFEDEVIFVSIAERGDNYSISMRIYDHKALLKD